MAHKFFAMILSLALAAMLCNSASAYTIIRRRPGFILPPVSGAQIRLARAGIIGGPLPPVGPIGPIFHGYAGHPYHDSFDSSSPYDSDNYRYGYGGRRVVYDKPDYSVNDYGQVQISY